MPPMNKPTEKPDNNEYKMLKESVLHNNGLTLIATFNKYFTKKLVIIIVIGRYVPVLHREPSLRYSFLYREYKE